MADAWQEVALVASRAPTFTRCTLSVAHLASIEVFPVGTTPDATTLHIVIDLDRASSVWEADRAIPWAEAPRGTTLRPQVRLPEENRLILEGTVPNNEFAAAEAMHLLGWMVEKLTARHTS